MFRKLSVLLTKYVPYEAENKNYGVGVLVADFGDFSKLRMSRGVPDIDVVQGLAPVDHFLNNIIVFRLHALLVRILNHFLLFKNG